MGVGELTGPPLDRGFFDRPSDVVAPDLLGRVVVHGPVALRLTEVEAYGGPGQDPASHTYRGRTPRNAVMFGEPGHLYVYFTYGMHFCANLVCMPEGVGSAVLLRAGEVIAGLETARARRRAPNGSAGLEPGNGPNGGNGSGRAPLDRDLARGPARLTVALGLVREHNGTDCCSPGPIRVHAGRPVDPALVRTGPRTGVAAGAQTPWRFWVEGDPTVSPYRAHVPRRRRVPGGQ
ncbi:DNA-3-methyladenine glycosylase [Microbispora corallina]|uniref:Putative 3-methyladenine DNA glycosylase n=1 Tax=Microbispora corallina TaxID=83302 RepID=A0ABQ4G9Y8_9ACTN|nr:DNA-3-methyladenine glycosylase [Microbispora corallina]GIH43872.1 putative 3-methyladenine DNA glycosylase [Microbispora corallina]